MRCEKSKWPPLKVNVRLTPSQTTNSRLFQAKEFVDNNLSLMKMAESSPKGYKKMWEKKKSLVASNFSFSRSVFKRLVQRTQKNKGLFWKGLTVLSNNVIVLS